MEIALLLVCLLGVALKMGERYALRPVSGPVAVPILDPPTEEEDGLLALPRPPQPAWTESASSTEMAFAGQALNFLGLLMLTGGALSYLRLSGVSRAATSGGWLQCLVGLGLGAFLSLAAERAFRSGLRGYAHPLLGGGSALTLLSLGAAHFHFHLLPAPLFAVLTFASVAWATSAAFRHDAPLIGVCLIGALFGGPLLMTFPLSQLGSVLGYLLAINLATTLVAYRMRWDAFLIASFAGTYGLYFHSFGLAHPVVTLGFLLATYALFLISGTLFHLLRGSANHVDLTLSLINPLLFAYASYTTLLQLPAGVALGAYAGVGALHLLLSQKAGKLDFPQIRWTHLALAIFFTTAGISFLIYCATDAAYFGLVTLLWLAQGFFLLWVSNRLDERSCILTRRASYLNMMLALYQLLAVVPWMEQPVWVELPGSLSFLAYFWFHETRARSGEERLFSNLSLLAAVAALNNALVGDLAPVVVGTALAPLLLLAYRRFPRTLAYYRYGACALATLMTILAFTYPWGLDARIVLLPACAALLASLSLIAERDSLESPLGPCLAGLLLLRFCVALALHWNMTVGCLLGNLVALSLLARSLTWPRLLPAALMGTFAIALQTAFLPVSPWPLVAIYAVCWRRLPELPALFLVKALLPLGTLPLCLLGLVYPRQTGGQILLFLAFLKCIGMDGGSLQGVTAVVACYLVSAARAESVEWRNFSLLQGLLVFAFQSSELLYTHYGILVNFQVLLSVFWAFASLLFVALGIHLRIKLLRFFGLVVLVSCLVKVYAVDVAVLDAYDRTSVTFALGCLLMLTSFFYQLNRAKLQPAVA